MHRRGGGDVRSRRLLGGLLLVLGAALPAPAGPARIVSLAPSVTETLFAVGAGKSVVGVTDLCDWPPEAREITRVGSYLHPNLEAVIARRPDLVIAVPSPGNREPVEMLRELGVRVVVASEGPTLDDVFASIRTISQAAGHEQGGGDLVDRMRARIEEQERRLAGRERRRVLFLVDRGPPVAAGDGTLLDELIGLAGGTNVAAGLGSWPRISIELVVRSDPEVILDGAMGPGEEGALGFYEGLGLTSAREGRVHGVRLDELMRPGPRLVEGLETLARTIHPEAFR